MASTSPDNIWIPDSDTPMVLDTMFTNLASSLQNGIGARLAFLERRVGCQLRNPSAQEFTALGVRQPVTTLVPTGGQGTFVEGMSIVNGAAIIEQPGVYIVSGALTPARVVAGSGVGQFWAYLVASGTVVAQAGTTMQQNVPGSGPSVGLTAIVNLKPGDTLTLEGYNTGFAMQAAAGIVTSLSCARLYPL